MGLCIDRIVEVKVTYYLLLRSSVLLAYWIFENRAVGSNRTVTNYSYPGLVFEYRALGSK